MGTDDVYFSEFLDDYYVECDEHLAVARRTLLGLERYVQAEEIDRFLLDELFRSFHSLKGLSAMVGLRQAEALAHQLESYLSALRKRQVQLSDDGLTALMAGIKAIELVIAVRKAGGELPDVRPVVAQIAAQVPQPASEGSLENNLPGAASGKSSWSMPAAVLARLSAAPPEQTLWEFTFVPSRELSDRGVNVNMLRERLQTLGELLHGAPDVGDNRRITFRFLVLTERSASQWASWVDDGIHARQVDPCELSSTAPRAEASWSAVEHTPLASATVVRVDLDRLDELMRKLGDLVIARGRLEEQLRRVAGELPRSHWRALHETNAGLERQLRDLRESVMRLRMVPVREIFARMQFAIHDLAREQGKRARLELVGEETEIDKYLVERMTDPLLHLVRNAVSHGLESPEARRAAGKPPEGRISLVATTTGETIVLEVEDDGHGIDAAAVFAQARLNGLLAPDDPADDQTLGDILCTPGFSTRSEADRASGRGVGMDVVRSAVEELGGSLSLSTRVGQGTRFRVQLPLTLAIADALIVRAGERTYAVPQTAVREIILVDSVATASLQETVVISYHGEALPLVPLTRFFGAATGSDRPPYALVIGEASRAFGLLVDRVLGLREIVVRPLVDPLVQVPGIGGATELGDGRAVLVLDTTPLARALQNQASEVVREVDE